MKKKQHLLEQIYEGIDSLYGTKQEDEYFTLVCRGPQIHSEQLMDLHYDSMTRMMEEDALTNCLCAPYQIVDHILPYSFSSRLGFALSMWTVNRQIPVLQNGRHMYQNEETFYESIRKVLEHSYEISQGIAQDFNDEDIYAWKKAFNHVFNAAKNLYEQYLYPQKNSVSFGESELSNAKDMLKNQRIIIPDKGTIYPVNCSPSNWVDNLSSSFQKQDEIPSLHDVLKMEIMNASRIEELLKKLMFYEQEDSTQLSFFLHARTCLLEKIVLLTKDIVPAHDQQLLFLIGGAFYHPQHMTAQTMKSLQRFFQIKQKPTKLRTMLVRQLKEQQQYWNTIYDITKLSYEDDIRKELCENLKRYVHLWKQGKKQLYQADRKTLIHQDLTSILLPEKSTTGYDSLLFRSTISAFYEASSLYRREKEPYGLRDFFGNHIPYGIDEEKIKLVKIDVGFQVTQVEIKRPWLNEDIFDLSFAFQRMCNEKISQGIKNLRRIPKNTILPSYPIRMVIAKDVTMRLDFTNAGKNMLELVEKSAIYGKGFLCFQQDTSGVIPHMERHEKILILRYPKAYLIGYFMHFTPKDKANVKEGGTTYGNRNYK